MQQIIPAQRQGPSTRPGPDFCPQIRSDEAVRYVPAGAEQSLTVQVRNLLDGVHEQFMCEYQIGRQYHNRNAVRVDDRCAL